MTPTIVPRKWEEASAKEAILEFLNGRPCVCVSEIAGALA